MLRRGDSLADLVKATQVQADDASHDCNYVYPAARFAGQPEGGVCVRCDEDGTVPDQRVEAMKFAVVSSVCIQRANGGRGQGIIHASWTDDGLELRWRFATSPTEVFEILRKVA